MTVFRTLLSAVLILLATQPAIGSTVSGRVVDANGQPVANAQIFLEPGVTRPVLTVDADAQGEFMFDDVPPQFVGVFAHSPGRGFGGKSIQVGLNDVQEAHTIVLGGESRVTLTILAVDGKPLSDARVVGVGLQQSRVGIPLQKLRRFGIQTPTSDANGVVVVPRMPAGEEITVKIAHDRHAQEVVRNIAPGSTGVEVRLVPGVLTSGVVKSFQRDLPVPNAPILFINADPPNDTSLTRADVEGVYYVRLRPGRYFYESFGADFASVRKAQVTVTGEYETAQLDLVVAATATIRGKVVDATKKKGEDGVTGARILLETGGAPNSIATTGESGEYEFTVPEGRNVIRFRRALGYVPPIDTVMAVTISAHEQFEAPDFVVIPIPELTPTVVNGDGEPVAGATARLIQPEQLGWYRSDDSGTFELSVATLPADGLLVGVAEDAWSHSGAMFTLNARDKDQKTITLKPVTKVSGRVEDADGDGLAGWNVHCELNAGGENALRLWSATTNPAGEFTYPCVLTDVPLTYWVDPAGDTSAVAPSPVSFTAPAGNAAQLPALIATQGNSGKSIQGETFPWNKLSNLEDSAKSDSGRVVVFASSTEFEVYKNTLATMGPMLEALGWKAVLVSGTLPDRMDSLVQLATGERPASAQTYLVNAGGIVIHETVGLPEFGLLRELGRIPL